MCLCWFSWLLIKSQKSQKSEAKMPLGSCWLVSSSLSCKAPSKTFAHISWSHGRTITAEILAVWKRGSMFRSLRVLHLGICSSYVTQWRFKKYSVSTAWMRFTAHLQCPRQCFIQWDVNFVFVHFLMTALQQADANRTKGMTEALSKERKDI